MIYTLSKIFVPSSKFQVPRTVGREGFEPPKAEPTGLQPVPFDRFGTYPDNFILLTHITMDYSLCKEPKFILTFKHFNIKTNFIITSLIFEI